MEKNSVNFRNLRDIANFNGHRIYPSIQDNVLDFCIATSTSPIITKRQAVNITLSMIAKRRKIKR